MKWPVSVCVMLFRLKKAFLNVSENYGSGRSCTGHVFTILLILFQTKILITKLRLRSNERNISKVPCQRELRRRLLKYLSSQNPVI